MLLASNAQQNERDAVAHRYQLDQATSRLGAELYALTGQARHYVITGEPTHLIVYEREAEALQTVEDRIRHIKDVGASSSELEALEEALRWADTLHEEQRAAIDAWKQGQREKARAIMFGAEYERELYRAEALLERFQYQLDQRTAATIDAAIRVARIWRTASELALGITALLFLFVLYFLFKKRVLRPVVKLSDVVSRLAMQDYAVEPPVFDQVDEIGDMAQAIGVFRENGLERQRLERERDVEFATRDLLSRMTQRMQGCDTQQDLEEVIGRFVPEIAPSLAGRLYLLDETRNAMVEACSWLSPVHSRAEFAPLGCWALRRGVLHRPSGMQIDVPCDHVDAGSGVPFDTVCLPLTAQRETFGLLYFEPRADAAPSTYETPEIYLSMLAENIGLALGNVRLRKTLRDMAMVDPLTGLANRRSLESRLAIEIAEAKRLDRPLSCLMVDVDHFKRFNDTHGHDAGDAVLRTVGEKLIRATREDGMAFRYGGEEFVLLLPGFSCEQALERAQGIRCTIDDLSIEHEKKALDEITVSLGLASAPVHCQPEQLLKAADTALREAKATGRNRVTVACPKDRRISAA
ncbi:MAG: diguanylate cyclase [Rhizobiaceae bacterium]|nr:diguanylate cyclase [Rhizobiaceae bacterium]